LSKKQQNNKVSFLPTFFPNIHKVFGVCFEIVHSRLIYLDALHPSQQLMDIHGKSLLYNFTNDFPKYTNFPSLFCKTSSSYNSPEMPWMTLAKPTPNALVLTAHNYNVPRRKLILRQMFLFSGIMYNSTKFSPKFCNYGM
jgi:hypothetical protein